MDVVLKNLVGADSWVFVDDIIVFSNTAEEHALRLENLLRRFDEANLQLHPGKCVIAQHQVQYLGFSYQETESPPPLIKSRLYGNVRHLRVSKTLGHI